MLVPLTVNLGFKPPPLPRTGPKPKLTAHSLTVLGRRITGGPNEKSVLSSFAAFRVAQDGVGEEGDTVEVADLSDSEGDIREDWVPQRRYNYSREHKLAAIEYFQTTWIKAGDTFERMSIRRAAYKLKISRKMLRSWPLNKEKIVHQPIGSRRSRQPWRVVKEQEMEV